jgi:thiol:disulfide interchange protein
MPESNRIWPLLSKYPMKRSIFLFIIVCAFFAKTDVIAQIQKHAQWSYTFSKNDVKQGETVDLIFTAVLDKDWYLYSSDFDPELGPMLTSFTYTPNKSFSLVGKLKPQNPKTKYEEIWGGNVKFFDGKAVFKQAIKVLTDNPIIKGSSEYQTCSHTSGLCVPGNDDFEFKGLKVIAGTVPDQTAETTPADEKTTAANITDTTSQVTANISLSAGDSATGFKAASDKPKVDFTAEDPGTSKSLWAFALAAFLSGLVALLTPCVFPIIPMTVSYFTNQTNGKFKALLYGISIVLIYTLIGTVVSRLNGPAFANFLSTHWIPNVLFFAIFFVFGLSFLGLFEIVLPSAFVNKMDAKSDQGGYAGIFFMAFTLVLVSFSCTGPIVGSLLVASAGGAVVKPIVGMAAFSSAFAIPFTLFALFPQWLKSLPKSGGWLNTVKVVLGFLELALALKFLSIADQVYHWRYWIVRFTWLSGS